MLHTSVKLNTPCEFINIVPLNPQISKCQIKVCYVGDAPNRNKSIITKEVAKQIANSLPGSPIVGYYRKDKEDFDQHSKGLSIEDGQLKIKDLTRPYGFVDLNAQCWFQKYIDDGVDEHEYLVTEGYLWTGQYPECRQILDRGSFGQSMELNNDLINAYWSKDNNGKPQFFIINEALISKLCILGDDIDPCFEGASITSQPQIEFSFNDDFKQEMREMFYQLQETLRKGGIVGMDMDKKELIPNEEVEYKKKDEEEKVNDTEKNQDENKQEDTSKNEDNTEKTSEDNSTKEEEDDDKKKKTKYATEPTVEEKEEQEAPVQYSLEDIPEYMELKTQYAALEEKYNSLVKNTEDLTSTLTSLQEFKKVAERKEKENLIEQFYMLSAEDKADVQKNIDTYSLDEIESKLSVLCFRKKVDLNGDIDHAKDEEKPEVVTYNVHESEDVTIPAWVKAVAATQEKM